MPSSEQAFSALPLFGMRVLDFCDQRGQSCGRLLADLGAEVILVEPPEGCAARLRPPLRDAQSLHFAVHAANKLSVELDLRKESDRQRFLELLRSSDLLIDGSAKGYWIERNLSFERLRQENPHLLILSITDFGLTGPYSGYVATEAVHTAMGALLARSGRDGREPLVPPGEMALETASVQATWVALLAYWQRLHTGRGDLLDFSINDAVAQILDPGIGASGSASAGKTPIEATPPGRPVVEFRHGQMPSLALMYPIFKCADGSVRICVLNPRQWQAMSEWLGPQHPFRDKKYERPGNRLMQVDQINALIARLFADRTRAELIAEGKKRGVPIASLARPAELFGHPHFAAREFFTALPLENGTGLVPSGYLRLDGRRIGIRSAAPKIGQHNALLATTARPSPRLGNAALPRRPLLGLRVLDLGVIVAGGELGRLFADQGAQVIKLENRAYGDGLRQSFDGNPVSISFAQASRGKLSMGLNLRSTKGLELFKKLVEQSDVVLTNFKPGTCESLGIDYATLSAINPRIICAESSAMGSSGPEARTMGYGPLVRASASLTGLWRYPDQDDGYGDGVTIYPDHFVARVSAIAILAKLIERESTGRGGFVDLSQAECVMNVLATEFLRESIEPGSMVAKGNAWEFDAPNNVFQCAGRDEWCVVAVTSDHQWQGLCRAMARSDLAHDDTLSQASGRLARRHEIEAIVANWCARLAPREITRRCQLEGVPAGHMLRLTDFVNDPHYRARGFFRELYQPTVGRVIATENGPVGFSETLPPPQIVRAPARAEHTTELAAELLGLSGAEIEALFASGDLEQGRSAEHGALLQKYKTFAAATAMNAILAYNAWRFRERQDRQQA